MSHETDPVAEHYTIDHLFEKIISSLEQAGIGRSNLFYQDIAAADQFHVGGMDISRKLAQQAGLQQGWQVLDIGCGIGGPCRMLAAEFRSLVNTGSLGSYRIPPSIFSFSESSSSAIRDGMRVFHPPD